MNTEPLPRDAQPVVPQVQSLAPIIARLEGGFGSDPRLNAEIDCAFRFPGRRPAEPTDFDGRFGYTPGSIKCEHGFLQAHHYTSRLDDVVELIESKMPGRSRDLLQEALSAMGSTGWQRSAPILPQMARAAMISFLRAYCEDMNRGTTA